MLYWREENQATGVAMFAILYDQSTYRVIRDLEARDVIYIEIASDIGRRSGSKTGIWGFWKGGSEPLTQNKPLSWSLKDMFMLPGK